MAERDRRDWGQWGSRFEHGANGHVVAALFASCRRMRWRAGKPHVALRLKGTGPEIAAPVTTFGIAAMEKVVRARPGCLPRDARSTPGT